MDIHVLLNLICLPILTKTSVNNCKIYNNKKYYKMNNYLEYVDNYSFLFYIKKRFTL